MYWNSMCVFFFQWYMYKCCVKIVQTCTRHLSLQWTMKFHDKLQIQCNSYYHLVPTKAILIDSKFTEITWTSSDNTVGGLADCWIKIDKKLIKLHRVWGIVYIRIICTSETRSIFSCALNGRTCLASKQYYSTGLGLHLEEEVKAVC